MQYLKWTSFPEIWSSFTGCVSFIAIQRVLCILTKGKCSLERESVASLSQAGDTKYVFREGLMSILFLHMEIANRENSIIFLIFVV